MLGKQCKKSTELEEVDERGQRLRTSQKIYKRGSLQESQNIRAEKLILLREFPALSKLNRSQ